MRDEVFLDASYAIALSSPTDEHHARARELAERIEAEETRLVTTRAVVLEIGNALAGLRYRRAAIELLDALENDPAVQIFPLRSSSTNARSASIAKDPTKSGV